MNPAAIEARASLRTAYNASNAPDREHVIRLALLVDESIYSEETRTTLYQWLTDQLN